MKVTWERLKELLRYYPETGIFTRLVGNKRNVKAGDTAGGRDGHGYIQLRVDGKRYYAHRLAWFYMTGEWPKNQIDHINDDNNPEAVNRVDNRWCNLRETDIRGNQSNRKCHREGHLVGTTFNKKLQKWVSQIHITGTHKHLGLYGTNIEASEVYQKALAEIST